MSAVAFTPHRLRSHTRPLDGPVDLLDRLGDDGFCWLTGPAGFVTAGVAARIPVPAGPGRFAAAAESVAALLGSVDVIDEVDLPGTGPLAVGALPFDDAAAGELVIPACVVGRTATGSLWVTELDAPGEPPAPQAPPAAAHPAAGAGSGDRRAWVRAVTKVLEAIDAGHVRKVVLAREVTEEATYALDRRAIVGRLAHDHPACFTYARGRFVGASPELLVRRSGSEVASFPMAGTVPRGRDSVDDARLVAALQASGKDAAEHALLANAVVAALAPACRATPRTEPAEVVRLANVSHLATRVMGDLAEPWPSALALVGRLHPTPAVGGLPRPAALAAIAALEGFDRRCYGGPVGWVDRHGDGEWAVALRCAELDGHRARLVAGAGIVAGSDPDAEWDETEAKLAAMRRALRP